MLRFPNEGIDVMKEYAVAQTMEDLPSKMLKYACIM